MTPLYRALHYHIRSQIEATAWQSVKDIPLKTLYKVENVVSSAEEIVEDNVVALVMDVLK